MKLICVVLLTFCSLIAAQSYNWFEESKIVNGRLASNSEVPYLIQLLENNTFKCGGTLISATHVVTAAHCVAGKGARNLKVIGGATFLYFGITRNVRQIVLPREWDKNLVRGDIAVLRLDQPMTGNFKTIPLCQQPIASGQQMKMAGWGVQEENSFVASQRVKVIERPVVELNQCQKSYMYTRPNVANEGMFCISNSNGQDTCQGDSGGPAVYNGQLCGIVSFALGCARPQFPGVYTDVYFYRDFVENAVKATP